jgi:stage V sporulation protein G
LKITQVEVTKKTKEGSRIRGFAKVTIDDCFLINDIRIIEGDEKLFIAMPSRKKVESEDGEIKYKDICHPLNAETRALFEEAIISKYNEAE